MKGRIVVSRRELEALGVMRRRRDHGGPPIEAGDLPALALSHGLMASLVRKGLAEREGVEVPCWRLAVASFAGLLAIEEAAE